MRIGLLSDTHGDLKAFERALEVMGDCDYYLHTGDVLYHGPRNRLPEGYGPAQLAERLREMENIYFVHGNCDADVDQTVTGHDLSYAHRVVELDGIKFFMIHGYLESVESRIRKAAESGAHVLIYGHTHVKELYRAEDMVCLNPGSCSLPKDGLASCAVCDDGMVKLLSCEDGSVLSALPIHCEERQ